MMRTTVEKRADYQKRADTFRSQLRAQGRRPRDEQEWPDLTQWVTIDAVATCRTEGCPVAGVGFQVQLMENADGIYRASCGRCNRPHTDVVATFDDGPVPLVAPLPARPPTPPGGPVEDVEP